ncbi:MAG: transcription antitermination factor NusB [Corynebacterium flavescens]|nr:transcription antitermination factor NusB [Corynebacterium flavescens]MDN6476295.1 transcription antitermination factor NusB [Corynebacterium flavescens]MDN6531873.1 transcription antitermination factor NusB [Corynebacterium flavescens]MDN6602362.1 transcription antitermination factor NusB [Corynebacterium flavescens]MDN6824093.1 transcription antitermination factor NusB [Corynebacterium flavescens]
MSENNESLAEHPRKSGINHKRHTARYRARRRAADILYEAENRDVDPVAIVEDRISLARDQRNGVAPIADYTKEIVAGAAEELDAIDETIARFLSEDWEFHRIPAVDRAIMRVSVWELLFNPDIPTATAVVEGVELASEYSTAQAAPYIHAVLDDVAQSRSADNPMKAGEDTEGSIEAEDLAVAEDLADVEVVAEAEPLEDTESVEGAVVSAEPAEAKDLADVVDPADSVDSVDSAEGAAAQEPAENQDSQAQES